ncbi:CHASE domain-containing protein [Gemmobacter nectariphilus]|uniref:CHASE domain-containing protein n=1 Tax=Gemmobacter nectariphilus TaxID=220343 RepID=UPI0003F98615|nr:CHASE domain-containing protein [Gemmobacter nectariphilus]
MLRKLHVPAIAFLVAAAVGAVTTLTVHRFETARITQALEQQLAEVADRVGERMGQISTVLIATRSYLGTRTADDIPRERFARYVDDLARSGMLAGVHGLGLALVVDHQTDARIEERIRRDYGPDRGIWPAEADPAMRTTIALLEPADERNLAAIGYDMFSEPVRRAAMRAAMDSGGPTLSGPVDLVQEITPDRQTGALMYLYMDGTGGGQPGFIYAPLRMGRLFEALGYGGVNALAIRVTDAASPDTILFQSADFPAHEAAGTTAAHLETTIAGRQWRFSGRRHEAANLLMRRPLTLLSAAASVLLSVLVALAVQGIAASIRHNRDFALAQQRRLQEKDLHLREMSHRLKNSLARVSAMTRQAARQAESTEAFVTSMTQRLHSMAQAQDLLIRSATDGADLRNLIQAELQQIYGDADAMAHMTGPEVRLNATQTQAMGLTVHELATNALKYGAGAAPGGTLAINWAIQRVGKSQRLRLVWAETAVDPVTPPERKGFGSQLIDSCIRLELEGTIERKFDPHGLTVTITFPL